MKNRFQLSLFYGRLRFWQLTGNALLIINYKNFQQTRHSLLANIEQTSPQWNGIALSCNAVISAILLTRLKFGP